MIVAIGAVIVGVVLVLVLRGGDDRSATSAATTTRSNASTTTEPVTRPSDAVDTTTDVQILSCSGAEGPRVRVTNSTAAPARYLVVLEISVGGTKQGTAGAQVPAIDAGQSSEVTLNAPAAVPADAECTVAQVVRTAS